MTGQLPVTTSLLESMTRWFTPTTLFLFVNLVIGTIVVTSRFTSNKRPRHHHYDQLRHHDSPAQLVRAPSLLDRVKSINFHQYKFANPTQGQEPEHVQEPHFFQQYTESAYDTNPVQPPQHELQPQLAGTPSLLDRVKSINFSLYNFPSYSQEQERDQHFFQQHTEPAYDLNPVEPDQPQPQPQLARAQSFLERVKSIKFSSVYRSQQPYPEAEMEVVNKPDTETSQEHKPKRSKSETKKSKPKVQESMKKSVSEKAMMVETEEETEMVERRRPQTARLERTVTIDDGDNGVDAKADDFINKFKKQLRLQRLDSLLRYKEMLQGR